MRVEDIAMSCTFYFDTQLSCDFTTTTTKVQIMVTLYGHGLWNI